MHLPTRTVAVVTVAAGLAFAPGLAAPAWAATAELDRGVMVEWIQHGPMPGVSGNVHIGRLQVMVPDGQRSPVSIYGEMFDYACPGDYLPSGLWLDALTQLDAVCASKDNLIIEHADLDLHVDGRLGGARAVGTIDYFHTLEPGPDGSLPVDLRWSAPGPRTETRTVVIARRPRTVEVTTTRQASVVGTIGTERIGVGRQISDGQTIRYKRTVAG